MQKVEINGHKIEIVIFNIYFAILIALSFLEIDFNLFLYLLAKVTSITSNFTFCSFILLTY